MAVAVALTMAGCGNRGDGALRVSSDGGTDAPAGGSGGGGQGGGAAERVPTACAVAAPTSAPPFSVRFRLHNGSSQPVFLRKSCPGPDFGVSSCASGFRDRMADRPFCLCSCEDRSCQGGLACGPCWPDEAVQIGPGQATTLEWTAIEATPEKRTGYSCVRERVLPPALYRVALSAYARAEDALAARLGREVVRDFALPAHDGVVDVALAADATPSCDPNPAAAAPVCTGVAPREQPCALPAVVEFAHEGGLAPFVDSSRLEPTAMFVHRRRQVLGAARPDVVCTTHIPRCSGDVRTGTTGDVVRALLLPDVAMAFGSDTPVYGYDSRANDGSVLVVRRSDGKSVAIGAECSNACARPLTAGLRELAAALTAVQRQGLADPACAALKL